MKFVYFPIQIRLFKLPPHYQSLHSRGEQDPEFWKKNNSGICKEKIQYKNLKK